MLALRVLPLLAMILMLALLVLVLLMSLMGRRGLGGDRRSKRQRQSGEKIFHCLSPERRNVGSFDQEGSRGGGGSNCGGMPSSAATGAPNGSARCGGSGVVKPASIVGIPAQAIMQSMEP